jgi:hypothetical protein
MPSKVQTSLPAQSLPMHGIQAQGPSTGPEALAA